MNKINFSSKKYIPLIIILIFPFIAITDFHGWGDDWALYLAQARSIVNNEYSNFLTYNNFNVENSIFKSPLALSWGYPILVSFLYKSFGNNYLVFKLQQILFIFIFYLSFFIGFRRHLNLISRIIIISLFGLNIFFLSPINEPLTDYAYLALSLLSLFGIFNIYERNDHYFNKYIDNILLSLLILFSYLVREIGLTLYITLFIVQIRSFLIKSENKLFKDKIALLYKDAFHYFTPYLIKIIYDISFNSILPNDNNFHQNEFLLININMLIDNIFYYLKLPAYFFSKYAKIGIFFYIASIFPFLIGIKAKIKNDFSFKIYTIINILVLILFPHKQGLRLIYPIIPILFYYVFIGLNIIYNQTFYRSKYIKKTYNFIALILLSYWLCSLYFYKVNLNIEKYNSPFSNYFYESIEKIIIKTDKNEKILFFKPRLIKYLTGRDSFSGLEINQIFKSDYFLHYKELHNSKKLLKEINQSEEIDLIPYFNNDQFTLYKISYDKN